ncbi:MAG: hypothetical protein U0271_25625 [Polyangiaceae bacterium]
MKGTRTTRTRAPLALLVSLLAACSNRGVSPRAMPARQASAATNESISSAPIASAPTSESSAPQPSAVASADDAKPDDAKPDETPIDQAPVALEEIAVKGDKPVLVVRGASTPIVYLHGRCGDPTAFKAWASVGRTFGTIISVRGDKKCKGGGRTQWTEDARAIDARVSAAISAVAAETGIELDQDRRVVVGYSQGSLRAEALATRFPDRYPLPVLIAGPRAPRDDSLGKAERVLLMVGERDVREPLEDAAKRLAKRGRKVRYLELPKARHGEYGPLAEPTMREGLTWLVEGERH